MRFPGIYKPLTMTRVRGRNVSDEDLARRLIQAALWMKRQYRDAGLCVARVFCDAKGIDADAIERELTRDLLYRHRNNYAHLHNVDHDKG